jgi:hypothetical protein
LARPAAACFARIVSFRAAGRRVFRTHRFISRGRPPRASYASFHFARPAAACFVRIVSFRAAGRAGEL